MPIRPACPALGCHAHVWRELDAELDGEYDEARPCISSLRRNLQRSHIDRLLELAGPENEFGAVSMTVATLGRMQLRRISEDIDSMLERRSRLDAYTIAHLEDAHKVIDRALDPQHIYNTHEIGGSEPAMDLRGMFGRPESD